MTSSCRLASRAGPFDVVLTDVVAQEADVVGDGAGDEVRVLRHEGDLAGPLGSGEHTDVSSVREHQAARGLAEARAAIGRASTCRCRMGRSHR